MTAQYLNTGKNVKPVVQKTLLYNAISKEATQAMLLQNTSALLRKNDFVCNSLSGKILLPIPVTLHVNVGKGYCIIGIN